MKVYLSRQQYRKGICLILFFGILLCFWQLGSTGLIDETPPLFAAASRAMNETGNWLTPRVNGLTRFDKPPLVYWLMGILYSLPGQNFYDPLGTWAARLPSAIASVLMMLFLGDTLMKWPVENARFPRRTAVIAALAFALSPIVMIWSRIAVSDALLCSTLGISLLLKWRTYQKQISKYWWMSWVVLGLSVLTKGPVALALVGITFIFFGFIQRDLINIIRAIKPLRGVVITLLISLPWYIAELIVEGKPFWDSFFGYHNFQRLTSVVNSHSQPWWFFIMMLVIASFPFTPFLFISLSNVISSSFNIENSSLKKTDQSLMNFAACWLLAVFVLFTLAATKLPSYWLPATPAAAIMISLASSDINNQSKYKSYSYLVSSILMISLAIPLAYPSLWIYSINDPEMPNLAFNIIDSNLHIRASIILLITSLISFYFFIINRNRTILFLQIPLILFQIIVMFPMWKLVDQLRQLPLRKVASQIVLYKKSNEPIAMVGIQKPSLHFYTKKLVTFESNDNVSVVNLSERLRYEEREKWLSRKVGINSNYNTLLMVIDNKTSSYSHWQDLNQENLGSFGIYKIWRIKRSDLEERELYLKNQGVLSNWRLHKNERL